MLTLRKFAAPEFVFGQGALSLAGRQAAGLGVRRALVVVDPGLFAFPWPDKVRESLEQAGVDVRIFSAFSGNPRDTEVMAGVGIFVEQACDALVALGGGSAMDCAKAIGIASANRLHILKFEGVDNVPRPGPPLVCVPTTAGTGAEVSQFAAITDAARKQKVSIASKTLIPDAALIDPEVTTSLPSDITAQSGLDALTHAMEAYVSNAHGPLTDLLAEEAIRLIHRHLLRAVAAPRTWRPGVACFGKSLRRHGLSNAILGAVHAMSHSLGGCLICPMASAMPFCSTMWWLSITRPRPSATIASAGCSGPRSMRRRRRRNAKRWCSRRCAPSRRRRACPWGFPMWAFSPECLADLAARAATDPCLLTNPRPCGAAEIETNYEKACQFRI